MFKRRFGGIGSAFHRGDGADELLISDKNSKRVTKVVFLLRLRLILRLEVEVEVETSRSDFYFSKTT
jgi:hypothetical protein